MKNERRIRRFTWDDLDLFLSEIERNVRRLESAHSPAHKVLSIDTEALRDSANDFVHTGEFWSNKLLRRLRSALSDLEKQYEMGRLQIRLAGMEGIDEVVEVSKRINKINSELSGMIAHSKEEIRHDLELFHRAFFELSVWIHNLKKNSHSEEEHHAP